MIWKIIIISRAWRVTLLACMLVLLLPIRQEDLDFTGYWALHWAARQDRLELIESLLQRQTPINQVDDFDYSPLHYAVQLNSNRAVERLLRAGADPNMVADFDTTPLFLAVLEGNPEVVAMLLAGGAEVDRAEYFCGATALHLSARNGMPRITGLLIRAGAALDRLNKFGVAPLTLAVFSGDLETLQVLLRAGAPVNPTVGSYAALPEAVMMGAPAMVEALLAHGAPMEEYDQDGMTPLLWAAYRGQGEAAELLLRAGAEPNRRERGRGLSPLHAAAVSPAAGRGEMIRLLVRYGAEVDGKATDTGGTPLYYAAAAGILESVEALLALGAAVDARADRDFDRSPWQVARLGRHEAVERRLREAGASVASRGIGVLPPRFDHLAFGNKDTSKYNKWNKITHASHCPQLVLYERSTPRRRFLLGEKG